MVVGIVVDGGTGKIVVVRVDGVGVDGIWVVRVVGVVWVVVVVVEVGGVGVCGRVTVVGVGSVGPGVDGRGCTVVVVGLVVVDVRAGVCGRDWTDVVELATCTGGGVGVGGSGTDCVGVVGDVDITGVGFRDCVGVDVVCASDGVGGGGAAEVVVAVVVATVGVGRRDTVVVVVSTTGTGVGRGCLAVVVVGVGDDDSAGVGWRVGSALAVVVVVSGGAGVGSRMRAGVIVVLAAGVARRVTATDVVVGVVVLVVVVVSGGGEVVVVAGWAGCDGVDGAGVFRSGLGFPTVEPVAPGVFRPWKRVEGETWSAGGGVLRREFCAAVVDCCWSCGTGVARSVTVGDDPAPACAPGLTRVGVARLCTKVVGDAVSGVVVVVFGTTPGAGVFRNC